MKNPTEAFGGRKAIIAVAVLLALGLLLLFNPRGGKSDDTTVQTERSAAEELTEYTAALEERISALVTSVDGISHAKVLITLESGREVVLAANSNDEISSDRSSRSESYLTLERSGDSEAVPITEICPKIRGVAVVCEHGSDPSVQAKLTALLSAALGIASNRIMITS